MRIVAVFLLESLRRSHCCKCPPVRDCARQSATQPSTDEAVENFTQAAVEEEEDALPSEWRSFSIWHQMAGSSSLQLWRFIWFRFGGKPSHSSLNQVSIYPLYSRPQVKNCCWFIAGWPTACMFVCCECVHMLTRHERHDPLLSARPLHIERPAKCTTAIKYAFDRKSISIPIAQYTRARFHSQTHVRLELFAALFLSFSSVCSASEKANNSGAQKLFNRNRYIVLV